MAKKEVKDDGYDGQLAFRKMLSNKGIVVAPGVFSPIAAQLAVKSGFRAAYFSGGGFANLLGLPDLGMTTLTEVSEAILRITSVAKVPLIVDVDTGFGEAVNVWRTVREMENAGAAAIHIEDQVMPKRCGHLAGKQVVETDEMVKKILAAVEARSEGAGSMTIIARTDAKDVEGFDATVERSKAYLKAGADMIFPEALESKAEFAEFAKKVKAPLLANMTEFGKSPYLTATEFEQLGYKVVIFPMSAFRTMLGAVREAYEELMKKGTQKGLLDRMMTREEIYELIGYREYEGFDGRVLRKAKSIVGTD